MENLQAVKWSKAYPRVIENEQVKMVKKGIRQMRLLYDIYEKAGGKEILLGTCEILCKAQKKHNTPVAIEYIAQESDKFNYYLQLANHLIKKHVKDC